MFSRFVLGPFLRWLPSFLFLIVWGFAANWYFKKKVRAKYGWLLIISLLVAFGYALLLSLLTHHLWAESAFDRILLSQPISADTPLFGILHVFEPFRHISGGYFIYYVFGRFWLNVLWAIVFGLIFYLILLIVARSRAGLLEEKEPLLALILTVACGWPGFIVFLPLTLLFFLISAIFNQTVRKKFQTALGPSMLAAALIVIALNPILLKITIIRFLNA